MTGNSLALIKAVAGVRRMRLFWCHDFDPKTFFFHFITLSKNLGRESKSGGRIKYKRETERIERKREYRERWKGTERERTIVRETRIHSNAQNRINTRKNGIFKLPMNCYPLQRSATEWFDLHCGQKT